jgi:hypothetical protein
MLGTFERVSIGVWSMEDVLMVRVFSTLKWYGTDGISSSNRTATPQKSEH